MLEDYVKGIEPYDSIMKLTFDIADSGGYKRKYVKFKNGCIRERTVYSKRFNSVLVALWLLHYKNFFIGKLKRRKDLSEHYVDIINKTFFVVMGCLNKDKVRFDNAINKYVALALLSRITDFSKQEMSKVYTDPYEKGKKYDFVQKYAVLNQAVPIESVNESSLHMFDIGLVEEVALELSQLVSDNPFGERVLDFLLTSDKKIRLKNIDKSLSMQRHECTEENRKLILDAYNKIKEYLLNYVESNKRFYTTPISVITYSFEVNK